MNNFLSRVFLFFSLAPSLTFFFHSSFLPRYLYLLFDEDNFIHDKPYVFTTEAHPFLLPPKRSSEEAADKLQQQQEEAERGAEAAASQKPASSMFDLLKLGVNTNPLKRAMGSMLGGER